MKEFIKQIEERIITLQKDPNIGHLARISELTLVLQKLKKLNMHVVGVTLPKQKLWDMAKVITNKQRKCFDLEDEKRIDWEVLTEDWFDWLEEEVGN